MTATTVEITSVAVTVTGDHIAAGEPLSPTGCPIALAFYDAIPAACNVAVHGGVIRAGAVIQLRDGHKLRMSLPAEAKAFILALDNGLDVEPFSFTAEVTQ